MIVHKVLSALFSQFCLVVLSVAVLCDGSAFAQSAAFERPPIDYLNAPVDDAVARLSRQLERGEVVLEFDDRHGYLKSVLAALDVPASSQTLVFSKTSLQLHRISPRRPRALYFNDDVYVGWCQRGDALELAATDAKQGAIFYTLQQTRSDSPRIVRDSGNCLTCHATNRTQNVPGYLVRSVRVDTAGHPILSEATFTSDHKSPFKERWGGWYVTGRHGDMQHMGNVLSREDDASSDWKSGANVVSLDRFFDTSKYLSESSDLVALMVLEHQTQTHNALTLANFETRQAMNQSFEMNRILEREPGYLSDSAQRRIDAVATNAVEHLLMFGEFQLTSPLEGTSDFAVKFQQQGPADSTGRSLRELDLQTRLFKYPCSYLVYSDSFHNLPDEVRRRIVDQMTDILSGEDPSPGFGHFTADLRQMTLEILRETHSDFRQ